MCTTTPGKTLERLFCRGNGGLTLGPGTLCLVWKWGEDDESEEELFIGGCPKNFCTDQFVGNHHRDLNLAPRTGR